MRYFSLLPLTLCWLVSGCHWFGGVHLENLATASGKPSNVAALVSVTKKHEPVRELDVSAFRIIEDGKSLDLQQSDARLLDPVTVAAFQTVLVLDLGHASTDERKKQLSKAAATFVRQVRQRQPVTVLVFDGSPRTRFVGDFSVEPSGTGPESLDNLLLMVPADPSRNLRGAVLAGLEALDSRLDKSTRPIRVGTLVVFSRGPDVAGRVPASDLEQRLDKTNYQLVYVDVAGDEGDSATNTLGKRNRIDAQGADTLPIAFEEAGTIASRLTQQYYLISYCSPARAGTRQLKIEVTVPGVDNDPETDAFETEFDATGFTPGCNAGNPPRFVVAKRDTEKNGAASKSAPVSKTDNASNNADNNSDTPSSSPGDDSEVPPPNTPGYAP
jgi:hypothetical protein